ncbi:hypothetical protein [Halosimplex salinum]|uniref:hypothetical protein n=1 Tax=Halosimplex salinum TaxID=1710538 RepID=UPI000F48EA4C|nr:hypothetical protein [Halosimplex salinum]
MARFTIELPADLRGEAAGRGDRTGADATGTRCEPGTREYGDLDAATRGFVSWFESWAGA